MLDERDPIPISAYIFGGLTPEEHANLMRRALDDQEVFDQIWEAVEDRYLLQDFVLRRRLLTHLEGGPERAWWMAAWHWLAGPAGKLVFVGFATACLALFLYLGPHPWQTEEPLTLVTKPSTNLDVFFQLPLRNPSGAHVILRGTSREFRPGELVHAILHLTRPAAVFALRRQAGEPPRMVFPVDFAAAADQSSGEIPIVFDPVSPTEDVASRRRFVLRVIVLPMGVDFRSQSLEWAKLSHAYTALEVAYDVVP